MVSSVITHNIPEVVFGLVRGALTVETVGFISPEVLAGRLVSGMKGLVVVLLCQVRDRTGLIGVWLCIAKLSLQKKKDH